MFYEGKGEANILLIRKVTTLKNHKICVTSVLVVSLFLGEN